MAVLQRTHIEVYVFRRRGNRVEFLCLRRSEGRKLAGVWQPVTGKSRGRERALDAAAREVEEETGLDRLRWWALETVTIYFDPDEDAVVALPLFAAEAPARARVTLSHEHDAFRWLPMRAAGARYLWEGQRRGLADVKREVLDRPRLARALEVTSRVEPARPPRRAAAKRTRAGAKRAGAKRARRGAARRGPGRKRRGH
jgi:dATP pyrophosphohydrolase